MASNPSLVTYAANQGFLDNWVLQKPTVGTGMISTGMLKDVNRIVVLHENAAQSM